MGVDSTQSSDALRRGNSLGLASDPQYQVNWLRRSLTYSSRLGSFGGVCPLELFEVSINV